MRARLADAAIALWLPVALVVIWWLASADSTSTFFPPLSTIVDTFRDTWLFAEVRSELVPSLRRLAGGVALGSAVGISVGVALGMSDVLRRAFTPAIEFMRAIPAPALVPAFIVLLGVGDGAKVLLVALGVLWPVLLNAIDGVRAIDPTVNDMMRVHRMPLGLRLRRVVLPAASPQIFAGLRTGLALGLVVMVISEMTASTDGLGFFIIQAQQSFAIPQMWSGIIVLGLLGFVVNVCFVTVERRVLAWHRGWRTSTLGERPEPTRRRSRPRRPARPTPEGGPVAAAMDVEHLSRAYTRDGAVLTAIEDVTLSVKRGEMLCVVGPSGCGKTTLLKCLSGLLAPTGGAVRLAGRPIDGPPQGLALVLQEYSRSLLPWFSALRNVTIPLKTAGVPRRERVVRAQEALREVELGDAMHRHPWQLSGGMQQRVAIARALATRPEVLVMDEPFAAVDAQTRADLEDLLLRVHAEHGITTVLVTHDIDEALYLADRVVVLSPRPTRVVETVAIDLPRPRDQVATKRLPRYAELRAAIQRAAWPEQ